MQKVKTIDEFNREQEAKKAAEPEKPKQVVMDKTGKRFMCANKGCADRSFLEEENSETACRHHSGNPIFHDVKKFWDCCTAAKPCYDWEDFQKIPPCSVGLH